MIRARSSLPDAANKSSTLTDESVNPLHTTLPDRQDQSKKERGEDEIMISTIPYVLYLPQPSTPPPFLFLLLFVPSCHNAQVIMPLRKFLVHPSPRGSCCGGKGFYHHQVFVDPMKSSLGARDGWVSLLGFLPSLPKLSSQRSQNSLQNLRECFERERKKAGFMKSHVQPTYQVITTERPRTRCIRYTRPSSVKVKIELVYRYTWTPDASQGLCTRECVRALYTGAGTDKPSPVFRPF